jgi:exopolyphosphatase/guanosine-5'-triphosphate,3'-diphosphate pyrophosphatase
LPSTVSRAEIRAILADTFRDKSITRAKKLDLDPLRSEYLPTALICLDAILEGVGAPEVKVCPVALREGLIYDFLEHSKPRTFARLADSDLRMHAALDLAVRCNYPAEHSHKVAVLAGQIFRQTTHLHGLGEGEARLLDYAAILHDIGYHIGYDKHHKHGSYLIMNGDLRGFTPEERNIVAQLVRYHRRATPRASHPELQSLPVKVRRTVKYLVAILRIADGLDRSHYSLVEEVKCRSGRGSTQFQVVTGARHSDVELDLYTAKRHARYFEKLFDVQTSFTTVKPAAAAAAG